MPAQSTTYRYPLLNAGALMTCSASLVACTGNILAVLLLGSEQSLQSTELDTSVRELIDNSLPGWDIQAKILAQTGLGMASGVVNTVLCLTCKYILFSGIGL